MLLGAALLELDLAALAAGCMMPGEFEVWVMLCFNQMAAYADSSCNPVGLHPHACRCCRAPPSFPPFVLSLLLL
jgi:hypothetical protein